MAEEVLRQLDAEAVTDGEAVRPRLRADAATAVLILALMVGTLLRLAPAAAARFPLNDGGMFSVMVDELRANHFVLPAYTDYNHANIPYAYPPLGLYLGAAATSLGLTTLQALIWLPALLCVLTLPAFYFMSRAVVATRMQAAIGAALFAVTPRALIWFVMGGGLTRSAGLLFSLLTIGCFARMCGTQESKHEGHQGTQRSWRMWLALTTVCGALTVLSHLEAAWLTACAVTLILLVRYRNGDAFLHALAAGAGVLLLTSPWWGTVAARHGFPVFLNAARSGSGSLASSLAMLRHFNPAEEPIFPLIAMLGLIGLVAAFSNRQSGGGWLLPAWLGLSLFIDPRSPGWAMVIPLVLLAAVGLTDLIIPGIASLAGRLRRPRPGGYSNAVVRGAVYLLAALMLANAALTAGRVSRLGLTKADRVAMAWAAANTPADAKFLVVTGDLSPMQDAVTEWFPALAGRQNLSTVQGSEWAPSGTFRSLLGGLTRLQVCFNQDAACLSEAAARLGLEYDYVWVEKTGPEYACPGGGDGCNNSRPLIESLEGQAELVYENERVVLLETR
jgi:hypothetical protein